MGKFKPFTRRMDFRSGTVTVHVLDFSLPEDNPDWEGLAEAIAGRDRVYYPTVLILAVAAKEASRFTRLLMEGQIYYLRKHYVIKGQSVSDPLLRLWRRPVAPHSSLLLFPLVNDLFEDKELFLAPEGEVEEVLPLLAKFIDSERGRRGKPPIFPTTLRELMDGGSIRHRRMASGANAFLVPLQVLKG